MYWHRTIAALRTNKFLLCENNMAGASLWMNNKIYIICMLCFDSIDVSFIANAVFLACSCSNTALSVVYECK